MRHRDVDGALINQSVGRVLGMTAPQPVRYIDETRIRQLWTCVSECGMDE